MSIMRKTNQQLIIKSVMVYLLLVLLTAFSETILSNTINVITAPEINMEKYWFAPLAGELVLATDIPVRVSMVLDNGSEKRRIDYHYLSTEHTLPVLGLKPNHSYTATISLRSENSEVIQLAESIVINTASLFDGFPVITHYPEESQPEKMAPGYTLFYARNLTTGLSGYQIIVDDVGDVVWFARQNGHDFRITESGDLMSIRGCIGIATGTLVGDYISSWYPANHQDTNCYRHPGAVPVDATRFHHEAFPTSHDTFLTLTEEIRIIENYPTSTTDPNSPTQTTEVYDNPIIEFDKTGTILHKYSLLDMLDPLRVSHDGVAANPENTSDWPHANAIIHSENDDHLIVSIRNQDAVVKFDRNNGQIKWILGPHANWKPKFQPYLLTPTGKDFEWQYKQHAPEIMPDGNILLFDNGTYRASAFEPQLPIEDTYSRVVEYQIDESNMTISQVWEYGKNITEPLFSRWISDADYQAESDTVLMVFGGVTEVNKKAHIIEVTRETPAERVFHIRVSDPSDRVPGWTVYRTERIPGLYHKNIANVTWLPLFTNGAAGKPIYKAGTDRGFFIWRWGNNWRIRWSGNGPVETFSGFITTDTGFSNIVEKQWEAGADTWSLDGKQLSFSGRAGSGQDGLNFTVAEGAKITVELYIDGVLVSPYSIHIGASNSHPLAVPVDISP